MGWVNKSVPFFRPVFPEEEIPGGLYLAVAQVLAYVYQIRQHRAGKGKFPELLKDDLPIPPDLRRDS